MKKLLILITVIILNLGCDSSSVKKTIPEKPPEQAEQESVQKPYAENHDMNKLAYKNGSADNGINESVESTPNKVFIPIFKCEPIPDEIIKFISGKSFKDETTFDYSELCYLSITYINFEGEHLVGEMIVSADVGEEVLDIFREIYISGFPIDKMRLVDHYDADDDLSMEDNNTSAFNFRFITNSNRISNHGYGLAIDINPVQNPYISGAVLPASGEKYKDRSNTQKGMIIKDDAVYQAFTSRGWKWGGDWNSPKDYQHFEKPNSK